MTYVFAYVKTKCLGVHEKVSVFVNCGITIVGYNFLIFMLKVGTVNYLVSNGIAVKISCVSMQMYEKLLIFVESKIYIVN